MSRSYLMHGVRLSSATARVCALHRKDNGFPQGKAFLFVGRILQLNPAWVYCSPNAGLNIAIKPATTPFCRIEKRNPAYNLDVGVRQFPLIMLLWRIERTRQVNSLKHSKRLILCGHV